MTEPSGIIPQMNPNPHECYLTQPVGTTLDVSFAQDGGVKKEKLSEGVGDEYPFFNDHVAFTYVGYIEEVAEDKIFDSSENDGKYFEFDVGRGMVVRGFETAVMTMKLHEHSIIYLQPEYAYGRGGSPPRIPAGKQVIFDVEIVEIREEDVTLEKDKTTTKKILKKGKGVTCPNEGAMIDVHIEGKFDDTTFMNRDFNFPYGEGTSIDYGVPGFIENVLYYLRNEEVARLTFEPHRAFGKRGCDKYDVPVPPNTKVVLIINLRKFEKAKDFWEMSSPQRLEQAELYKQKGTHYLKKNEMRLALKYYARMVDYLECDTFMEGEEEVKRRSLLVVGNLNLSLVHGKNNDHKRVIIACTNVINMDHENVKAYFRRGKARYERKEYKESMEDFTKVLELEPNNKLARNYEIHCNKAIQTTQSDERKLAQSMLLGLGKKAVSGDPGVPGSGMNDISDWDNSMADGMITLEQERAAFGDDIPTRTGNNHGIGD